VSATVTALRPRAGDDGRGPVRVIDAVEAFLATPRVATSANTRRAYGDVLRRVAEAIRAQRALADVADEEIATALEALWGQTKPTTWNRNRATVMSWLGWCARKARWSGPELPATCERRREPDDQTRAVEAARIDAIYTRRSIPLRERLL